MAFEWPHSAEAAISLTFDDGMRSQRETGVPLLNQYGVRGTFYVNPKDDYAAMLEGWRAAAEAGHEIGNHTVNHPCSKNFPFISEFGRRSLEEMNFADIAWEIDETNRRLGEVLPQRGPVSFAYPCYQPFVGRGAKRQSYVPVVLERCVAGRGRGEQSNDPRYCDLGYLWSWPCERAIGQTLIGIVEQAAVQGRWAILTFHGIQEGHLSVAEGDLAELCAHLQRSASHIWAAPVAEVAQWVSEKQKIGM
ncbi:MAG: polysaccharide deacetylase family protein [Caldilineaceae bacterium]|nr:polysaccharide deacetylase family protein [Caldilineaceae bacterium]